jgi:hypothetical protein
MGRVQSRFPRGRKPPVYLLTTTEALADFERIAADAAIPLRPPTKSEFGISRFRNRTVADPAPCGPGRTIAVLGWLDWSDAAPGRIGNWHTCWQCHQRVWGIRGTGGDLAFANIVEGAMLLISGRGTPDMLQENGR